LCWQSLLYARIATSFEASDFRDSTKGVLFFGTPHSGSAWSGVHAAYLKLRSYFTPATEHIAKLLSKNSDYLQRIQSDFALFSRTLNTRYFFEEIAMGTGLGRILVGASVFTYIPQ
jgi:hypothetical protein